MKTPSSFQSLIISESVDKLNKVGNVILDLPVGTGKTGISLLLAERRAKTTGKPILVVVAKSILSQWQAEAAEFLPGCCVKILHPEFSKNWRTVPIEAVGANGQLIVYLITPETVGKMYALHKNSLQLINHGGSNFSIGKIVYNNTSNLMAVIYNQSIILNGQSGSFQTLGALFSANFAVLVVDEAHTMLNPTTNKVKGLLCIRRDWTILSSATLFCEPNDVNQFGLSMLCARAFRNSNCGYNFSSFSNFLTGVDSYKITVILSEILVSRQKNDDHVLEIDEQDVRTEIVAVAMSNSEIQFFDILHKAVNKLHKRVSEMANRLNDLKGGDGLGGRGRRRQRRRRSPMPLSSKLEIENLNHDKRIINGLLLSMINLLRLSVCSTSVVISSLMLSLVDVSTSSVMFDIVQKDIIDPLFNQNGGIATLSSSSNAEGEGGSLVVGDESLYPAGERDTGLLDKDTGVLSSRMRETHRLLMKHSTERVVLFASFRMMVNMMQHFFPMMDAEEQTPRTRQYFSIMPGNTMKERKATMERFASSANGVLLMTYKIGSVGINLQSASVGIVFDQPWNPDEVYQALGRVHRRGNTHKKIRFYKLISNTAMEHGILNLHYAKHQMSAALTKNSAVYGKCKAQRPTLSVVKMIEIINSQQVYDSAERIESGKSKELLNYSKKSGKEEAGDDDVVFIKEVVHSDYAAAVEEVDSDAECAQYIEDTMSCSDSEEPDLTALEIASPKAAQATDDRVMMTINEEIDGLHFCDCPVVYNKHGERLQ